MTTWVGGGNNQASNPTDWSPNGLPQPGDALQMNGGTMKINDTVLAGGNTPLFVTADATLNVSNSELEIVVPGGDTTIHASGNDTMFVGLGEEGNVNVTLDLDAHAQWVGAFQVNDNDKLVVNGQPGAVFVGSGSESVIADPGASATFKVDLTGNGQTLVALGGSVEFGGKVGAGQEVILSTDLTTVANVVTIDRPQDFAGTVQLGIGEIDLNALARADSYSYQNDMLSIFSGTTVIDSLRLTSGAPTPPAFAIEKTGSGSVVVFTSNALTHPAGTPLPLHA